MLRNRFRDPGSDAFFLPLEPESLSDNVMGQKYNQKSFNFYFFYFGYLRLQKKVGQQKISPPLLLLLLDPKSAIYKNQDPG